MIASPSRWNASAPLLPINNYRRLEHYRTALAAVKYGTRQPNFLALVGIKLLPDLLWIFSCMNNFHAILLPRIHIAIFAEDNSKAESPKWI